MKLVIAVLAAATLAACASGPSTRGGGRDEPMRAIMSADVMMFVGFDTDADLNVTAAEVDAGIAREFARADANRDGNLQPIEFQNWGNLVLGGGQIGPFRLDFDRDVDNIVTRQEFETEIRGRMRDYDSDENNVLTRPEFVRLIGQARPPPPPRRVDGDPRT